MSKQKRMQASPPSRGIVHMFNMLNLKLPKELRLPPLNDAPNLNALKARFNELEALLARSKTSTRISYSTPAAPNLDEKAIANLATNAWRAKTKMLDQDSGEVKEEMKRVYRHIEAIFETLKGLGAEILDPYGRNYDSGMALKVISFEPTPGVSKEEIKETIKPSVMWQGRLIQMGEVIVGTPSKLAE